jgi:hypothetical protein
MSGSRSARLAIGDDGGITTSNVNDSIDHGLNPLPLLRKECLLLKKPSQLQAMAFLQTAPNPFSRTLIIQTYPPL